MKYQKNILKNGLRLITVPIKNSQTITVSITANVGARYENEKNNGISHFLEHLMFKGTPNRTNKEITLELDTLGAAYNAFTSYEATSFWIKANKKYFKKVLNTITDLYLNANFPEEEINKERGVILEEINMYEDDNQSKAQDLLRDILYPKEPMGAHILGTKNNIKNLTREDFLNYKNNYYNASSTTITISGDVNPKEVKKIIEEKFATLEEGKVHEYKKVKKIPNKKQVINFNKKTDQTHLVLGFKTFDMYHKDAVTLKLLRGILSAGMSSRLFSKMREELGICYYCYAGAENSYDSGYLGIAAGVGNKRTEEAIKAILEILNDIKTNGVEESELNKVKKNMIGKMAMALESSDEYADYFGFQEVLHLPIKTPEQYLKEVKSVTTKDIKRVAAQIFDEKNIKLALVGPHKDKNKLMNLLKF